VPKRDEAHRHIPFVNDRGKPRIRGDRSSRRRPRKQPKASSWSRP